MSHINTTIPAATACPYAAVLSDNDEDDHSDSSTRRQRRTSSVVSACPAYQDGCPFKDKSSDEIREMLTQVPASHLQSNGTFSKVMQNLHQQVSHHHEQLPAEFQMSCPVPPSVRSNMSFGQALEELSLAAVMAKLAADHHDDDDDDDDDDDRIAAAATAAAHAMARGTELVEPGPIEAPRKSLSQSLKTGTAVAHQAAEDVHFVANFIKGNIDRALYAQLIIMLYHVYQALENALQAYAPHHFPTCYFTELNRVEALQEDLDFWVGSGRTHDTIAMSDATRDYVQRIQDIASRDPLLLLSHAYTRYLGDLSGGKVLRRVAKRALQLEDNGDGLAFYDFGARIPSAKRFKDQYRQCLDDLPLNESQIQRLVAEANVAFLLNVRLFEELDVLASVPGAKVRPLQEALHVADHQADDGNASAECPFLAQKKEDVGTKKKGKCPWPFILLHDPVQGLQDWKTWMVMGLLLCIIYRYVLYALAAPVAVL